MTPIAPHIEAFLREHLSHHRGASQHSYAYSFQLLFEFAATRLKVRPSSLALEQLDSRLVSAFLEYLEDTRQNAPETRNARLAAIKSFFHFLEYRQPAALEQIRRVLAIPFKKTDARLVPYLGATRSRPYSTRLIRRRAMGSGIVGCCTWQFVLDYVYPN